MGTMKVWDIRTFECVQSLALEDCKGMNSFSPIGSQRYHFLATFTLFNSYSYFTCRILVAAPKHIACLEVEKPKNPTLTEESNLIYCGYNNLHGTVLTASGLDVKVNPFHAINCGLIIIITVVGWKNRSVVKII